MKTTLYFIVKEIVERIKHEMKTAKQLQCTAVGIYFGDFYEDFPCSMKQYILGTTWTDFFEDVWENRMHDRLIDPDTNCEIMEYFVNALCECAVSCIDELLLCVNQELSNSVCRSFSCEIIDRELGKLQVTVAVDN